MILYSKEELVIWFWRSTPFKLFLSFGLWLELELNPISIFLKDVLILSSKWIIICHFIYSIKKIKNKKTLNKIYRIDFLISYE